MWFLGSKLKVGSPEPPPGPPGQVQDLQEHLQESRPGAAAAPLLHQARLHFSIFNGILEFIRTTLR